MINFQEFYKTLFNLIYPRYCNFCENKILDGDIYFCNSCYHTLDYLDITNEQKLKRGLRSENFYSLFYFDFDSISQKIIHLIKYGKKPNLGIKMGKEFGAKLSAHNITADFIIPLPLHISRERERGYNQAEVIAKGLSQILNIPIRTNIIKRIKYTKSQTKLSKEQREKNVRNAFVITECNLTGKEIFILDDVITSGATINVCIDLLEKRGAKKITALSLALVRDIHDMSALDI
jgi:ComF family protein